MATINFSDFNLKTPILSGDFLVGYDENTSDEIRTKIKDIVDLTFTSQTFSFNENDI